MCSTPDTSSLMAMFAHDLFSLTCFLTSHPIHSAYLLFFSPYIFSLLSFLSPLLLSTLLSLLAVLSISPYCSTDSSSHLLTESFEPLGKTCGIALKSLRIVPGPRQEDTIIGMLEELDEMVLSPIAQALSGGEISSIGFQEIMKELCNSSSNLAPEVQTTDQEVSVPKCGNGEQIPHDEKLESTVQCRSSKFINSCSLVGGEFDQALMVGGNYEEKKGCDVNMETYTLITNSLVSNSISSTMHTLLDENGVSCDQEESSIKANLEDSKPEASLAGTGTGTVIGTGTDMSSGELDDYISCASDVEGKESESEENDPKNVNLENFVERTDGIVVGNGGEKLVPNGVEESLVRNGIFIEGSLTKSMSTNRGEHARTPSSQGLQREGSLRVDREWKRTLACKLYEERITSKLREERAIPVPVKEGEGEEEEMDLIWEAIEVNSNKSDGNNNKSSTRSKAKKEVHGEGDTEDDEGEEDDMPVRQLCCLQAFRVSTRKMNLGVGRPNLLKLSKVLKKMSVFHVGSRKSSKISEEKQIDVNKG